MDTGSARGDRDSEAGRRESASHTSVQPSATSSMLSSASEPITTLEPIRSATSSVESRRARSEPSLKRTPTPLLPASSMEHTEGISPVQPQDDLHHATLTVRDTLFFALKARTPDKASRLPGESREEYQQAFLSAIAQLFRIEHALDTKVGNEMIRGVSGGGKKRVSIARRWPPRRACSVGTTRPEASMQARLSSMFRA